MNEFEKYPQLTTFIQELAGVEILWSGHYTQWSAFLASINDALKQAYDEGYIEGVAKWIKEEIDAS